MRHPARRELMAEGEPGRPEASRGQGKISWRANEDGYMPKADFSEIPVINIAALLGRGSGDIDKTAAEIVSACETAGFFYVVEHGIASEAIDAVFKAAHWFFTRPQGERDALNVSTSPNFRGYVPMGITGPNVPRRMLEAFQMMLELGPDDPGVRAGNVMYGPNRWPDGAPEFRAAMEAYYSAVTELSHRLLGAFARGLALPDDYFRSFFRKPLTQLRLLHYPPRPPESTAEGVEAHTDTGAFTILLQDEVGGLEVRNRAGAWLRAAPIAGSFVINIADMMQRWTNGRFVSTPHRVANRTGRDRISVPFFANPDYDATIAPLATNPGAGDGKAYEPLACGPYVEAAYRAAWPRAEA
jgi:isopenicillin N synthase-like dioxygenase